MRPIRRLSEESGQTLIVTALCMTVLMGFMGLAIDVGHLRLEKRRLQAAADAAALAAGRESRVCGVNNYTNASCAYMTAAAQSSLQENGYTVSQVQSGCPSGTVSGVTLYLNEPPQCLSGDPNAGKPGFVEVVVSKKEPTWFSQLFGLQGVQVSARAESTRNLSPPCIYALDPTGPLAVSLVASVLTQVNCTIVDESNASNALQDAVCLLSTAPKILVHGNDTYLLSLLCRGHVTVNAPVPTPADPLAYLPAPAPPPPISNDSCSAQPPPKVGLFSTTYTGSATQVNINLLNGGGLLGLGVLGNITFNPGVYCGGINITLNALSTITFNPGIYILKPLNGTGGLNIFIGGVASTIQVGTGGPQSAMGGVMFYNEGPAASYQNYGFTVNAASILGTFKLNAPTSGEYAGVLFYQRADNQSIDNISVNLLTSGGAAISNGNFDGAIYAPTAKVQYAVNALASSNNIIVGYDVSLGISALASFGSPQSTSSLGSPLVGDDAVLVQ